MRITTLGDVFERITNGKNVRQNGTDGGMPITRIETISSGEVDPFRVGYAGLERSDNEKWVLRDGDILMSHINSPMHVGKCALYTDDLPEMVHGMNLLRLEPNRAVVDSSYAVRYFRTPKFRAQLHRFINQAVNQASVSVKNLKSIEIVLPPLDEQRRIAYILDKAETLRAKRREAISQLEAFGQSIFHEMFGDPLENLKGWNCMKLGELGIWQSGGTPSRTEKVFYGKGHWWYTSGELESKWLARTAEQITTEGLKRSAAKLIPSGALLLGMYDTAALKSGITTQVATCNQAIAFAQLEKSRVEVEFVYEAVKMGRERYRSLQRGVRQKNLNLSIIRDLEIPVPPLGLQREFVGRIAAVEHLKEKHQAQLSELDNLFLSLQDRAFKGEL